MENQNRFSGSDIIGVANFYNETNRFNARKFEDKKALSFINPDSGEIDPEFAYTHQFCPLCKETNSILLFTKHGYKHWKCNGCNLIYVNPCIKQEVILEKVYGKSVYPFFDSVNSESQKKFDKLRFEKTLRYINSNYNDKKSILDIGCGSGFFLKLALENGFNKIAGVDALAESVEYAKKVFELDNIFYGDYHLLRDLKDKFDVISIWELLDHVVHPLELIEIATNLLSENGILVISVRNGYSLAARILRENCNMFLGYAHTNFWNKYSFKIICDNYGFQLKEISTYISELSVINNYLEYESPYSGTSELLSILPTEKIVLNELLGYKFITVLQKL